MTNKLYILCGLPFSGKTTLAKILVSKLNFTRIDLDEIKFSLFGNNITDDEIDQNGWDKVYLQIYQNIERELELGNTVVYDTGNFTKNERTLVKNIADKLAIESITIFVSIPEDIAYQRLINNRVNPIRFNVTDEDFKNTIKELEVPDNSEKHLVFNYNEDINSWIDKNLK